MTPEEISANPWTDLLVARAIGYEKAFIPPSHAVANACDPDQVWAYADHIVGMTREQCLGVLDDARAKCMLEGETECGPGCGKKPCPIPDVCLQYKIVVRDWRRRRLAGGVSPGGLPFVSAACTIPGPEAELTRPFCPSTKLADAIEALERVDTDHAVVITHSEKSGFVCKLGELVCAAPTLELAICRVIVMRHLETLFVMENSDAPA